VLPLCQRSCGGVGQPLAPMDVNRGSSRRPLRVGRQPLRPRGPYKTSALGERKIGLGVESVVEPGSTPGVWAPSRMPVDD
jgi:hypothetical protein